MIGELLLIAIPAYISNSIPVILGGGAPIDFGIKFKGKRLLGKNKTIRGFLAGVSSGIIVAYLLSYVSSNPFYFYAGIMSSLGAMVGDSFGSFIKRRIGMKEGSSFQLDGSLFILFSLAMAYPFAFPYYDALELVGVIILTQALHMLFNKIAFYLKWKNVPW